MILPENDIEILQKDTLDKPLLTNGVKSLIFVDNDFNLTSSQITDFDTWFSAYSTTDNEVNPVHGVKTLQASPQEDTYNTSLLGFTYKLFDGKIRATFSVEMTNENYKRFRYMSGQDVSLMYVDRNNNIHSYLNPDDGLYYGFQLNLVDVQKKELKDEPTLYKIYIEFKEENELNDNEGINALDWNINYLFTKEVLIVPSEVSDTRLYITVTYNGEGVNDIVYTDVSIYDENNGEITVTAVYLHGDGYYFINLLTPSITIGRIEISNRKYIGCARYVVEQTVPPEEVIIDETTDQNLRNEENTENLTSE